MDMLCENLSMKEVQVISFTTHMTATDLKTDRMKEKGVTHL
jgi:hypothetical protein